MKIISRKEAMALGMKSYFNGKPCKHGHIAKRRTATAFCNTCNALYSAKYRIKNLSAVRLRERRYAKQRRDRNPEKYKEYMLKYQRMRYNYGPINLKTEGQWLRKNQAQLRQVKRMLRQQSYL